MTLNRREFVQFAVDDHVAIHNLARRILEPEGYMAVSAADAALRWWR
jgi:hypothetical protein